jgi:uncharacterized coiled-coil DUF342 family protein
LVAEQKEIRRKQGENKSAKTGQQEKFNRNDAEIKKLIADQKEARNRAGFKSAAELEQRIKELTSQVDSGKMKLVDEKKTLDEISKLKRQQKTFGSLDDLQKRIDAKKAENTELKKTFDNAESRDLSQKYETNQKELDDIKAGREQTRSNMDTLRADRDRLHQEQQETYQAIRKIKDEYYQGKKAYKEYEDQIWQQRREKKAAEDAAYRKGKRQAFAAEKLEEAKTPAFTDEIRTAEGLIKHFDPSYGASEGDKGPSEYAATAQRSVDESSFKGMKVMKKDEEDFFVGSGGKKKKGGKKGAAANGAETGKLNLNVRIIEDLGVLGVDPPSSQADIPNVVEKLKGKVADWKKNQAEETEKVGIPDLSTEAQANVTRMLPKPRLKSSAWRKKPTKLLPLMLPRVAVRRGPKRWLRRMLVPRRIFRPRKS